MKNWVEIWDQVRQDKHVLRTSTEIPDGVDEPNCVLHMVWRIPHCIALVSRVGCESRRALLSALDRLSLGLVEAFRIMSSVGFPQLLPLTED
jgi:hypothetical protein